MILHRDFFTRHDTVQIARELLGKRLVTRFNGRVTSGIISETEAYTGISDRASHAYGGRRTSRTEIMYRIGGTAYIYLCYGIHSLFNIVTHDMDQPHAVLIRGIIPENGQSTMLSRSGKASWTRDIANGPGKVSTLLGIHYSHSGMDLTSPGMIIKDPAIWVEESWCPVSSDRIETTPRIGIDYAGEDALLPYRFVLKKKAAD